MLDASALIGTHDVLLVTLDTLRYDVAEQCLREGRTPNLARAFRGAGWEKRHSPGNFTYAAHQAFFAGFLPTPAAPGKHPRLDHRCHGTAPGQRPGERTRRGLAPDLAHRAAAAWR